MAVNCWFVFRSIVGRQTYTHNRQLHIVFSATLNDLCEAGLDFGKGSPRSPIVSTQCKYHNRWLVGLHGLIGYGSGRTGGIAADACIDNPVFIAFVQ